MISDVALSDFKKIWLDEFGTEIPNEVAIEEAINLLTMFDAIYRPIKQEWVEENENAYGTHNQEPTESPDACEEETKENEVLH